MEQWTVIKSVGIDYRCCPTGFFIHAGFIVFLVGFAGLMSGLNTGAEH